MGLYAGGSGKVPGPHVQCLHYTPRSWNKRISGVFTKKNRLRDLGLRPSKVVR